MCGCLIFIDGAIAVIFFLLFDWFGLTTFGLIGAVIIGLPAIIGLLKKVSQEEKEELRKKKEEETRKERELEEQREQNRQNAVCLFEDGITRDDFCLMAIRVAKRIRRLTVSVNGPMITGTVESQSGISTWKFVIDFNDFGHITGNWWITYRGNYDSNIPNRFADLMAEEISKVL